MHFASELFSWFGCAGICTSSENEPQFGVGFVVGTFAYPGTPTLVCF